MRSPPRSKGWSDGSDCRAKRCHAARSGPPKQRVTDGHSHHSGSWADVRVSTASVGTALVTGGTHGIGLECVRALSAQGWRVAFTGRDEDAAALVQNEAESRLFIRAEMNDAADIERTVDAAIRFGDGKLGALVNNAGRTLRKPFTECSAADWADIFDTNSRSAFLFTLYALPALIAARGSVVFVSSVAGLVGETGLALYAASKAALLALAKSLALEYGRMVRFNAICPGQVATRMMDRVISDPALLRATEAQIPAGRLSRPSEVASVVRWLLSTEASYINGAVIVVDGGQTAGILGAH
jgi:NAD(P)-dependent dehydrogenase (short-subunit alcohol dehydrogenase family)